MMQPIEITQIANGQPQSMLMPSLQHAFGPGTPNLVPGPDVIVGDIEDVSQLDQQAVNGHVGIEIGTESLNTGDLAIDWYAEQSIYHTGEPQNM